MAPRRRPRPDWQPDEADELLLQSLLLPDEPGHQAWLAWTARVQLDDVGAAAYRLLPELYQVLVDRDERGPDTDRLKGISRKTWYENQLQQAALVELTEALRSAGLEPMLLRGAIPPLPGPAGHSPRNTSDLACGVLVAQVPAALGALANLGWRPARAGARPERDWRYLRGMAYQPAAGDQTIELLWRLVPNDSTGGAEPDIWQRSRPVCVALAVVRAPDPTDSLILTCLDGTAWHLEPDWRWAVDGVRLIKGGAIDWERLVETSSRWGCALPVREALTFMASTFQAPIPAVVLGRMQSVRISVGEARGYALTSRRPALLGAARKHWHEYRLVTAGQPPLPAGFVRYLKAVWGLGSTWQVLREIGKRGWMGVQPAC